MSGPVEAVAPDTAPTPPKGRLKVFLGYAAGVGKTYQMLDEAQELRRKGADVAVGYFEPHGRQDTIAKTADLEIIPRRKVEYRGAVFEEMDVDAILRRKPAVCLVDEFAHTNVPGSLRLKRWEDVQVLLQAGIDVLTTLNVQHLESLNDEVWHITGVRVRETVPDWVVDAADEVVLVDLTAEALQNRLHRGVVYTREKAMKAMENFFTEANLTALREMALRHTAHEVEGRLSDLDAPAPGRATCSTLPGPLGARRQDSRAWPSWRTWLSRLPRILSARGLHASPENSPRCWRRISTRSHAFRRVCGCNGDRWPPPPSTSAMVSPPTWPISVKNPA